MNHETGCPLRYGTLQMYHITIRGILVSALRMSMTAKFAIRIFGTVRRVLNRTSKRQIIPFPIIDPIITTVIIKMCDIFSTSLQELICIVSFIAQIWARWRAATSLQTFDWRTCYIWWKAPNVPAALSLRGSPKNDTSWTETIYVLCNGIIQRIGSFAFHWFLT